MRKKGIYFCALILFFLGGCALKPKFIVQEYYRPQSVAVLPFENQSNNLAGPQLIRKLFSDGLDKKGYSVQPLEDTDEKLREAGITDAGQLPTITAQELKEKLGVDGVFYGSIRKFNYMTLGFYSNRAVHVSFKLVDVNTNTALWEDERKISIKDLAFSVEEAKENLKYQLIEKTVENLFKSPLLNESRIVVRQALSTLP